MYMRIYFCFALRIIFDLSRVKTLRGRIILSVLNIKIIIQVYLKLSLCKGLYP